MKNFSSGKLLSSLAENFLIKIVFFGPVSAHRATDAQGNRYQSHRPQLYTLFVAKSSGEQSVSTSLGRKSKDKAPVCKANCIFPIQLSIVASSEEHSEVHRSTAIVAA